MSDRAEEIAREFLEGGRFPPLVEAFMRGQSLDLAKRLRAYGDERAREMRERILALCDKHCNLGGDIPYPDFVPEVRDLPAGGER